MNINWYPGHMVKAKKKIEEDLKLIDVVLELLDARCPISSQNPDINDLIKGKRRIVILNKSDLADEKENLNWAKYFKNINYQAVIADANTGKGIQDAIKMCEQLMKKELGEYAKKGRVGKSIRILVLGIPNVRKVFFH